MFYVYILKSNKDYKYYIGQTNNLEDRLLRHNSGRVSSTRNRIPLKLIKVEKFYSRSDAINRERYLKSLKGGNEFRKLLCDGV